jgi:hypothetical protein
MKEVQRDCVFAMIYPSDAASRPANMDFFKAT